MGRSKKCRRERKVKYATHELALIRAGQILNRLAKERKPAPDHLRAYRCRFGNHYHLTSK